MATHIRRASVFALGWPPAALLDGSSGTGRPGPGNRRSDLRLSWCATAGCGA